ncbi:MAG: sugar ABC transporter permease [Lacisediminihabitans sp.]
MTALVPPAVSEPSRTTRGGSDPRRAHHRRLTPAVLFLAPSAIILGVFVIWPILQSLYFSLFDWTIGADSQKWVGAGNYIALTQDPRFWSALGTTLIFTSVTVVVVVTMGFLTALGLLQDHLLTRLFRSVYFFPTVVSLVSIGLVWKFLLDPSIGFVGGILKFFGAEPIAWLQSTQLALPAVIFVAIWKNIGFAMVIFVAGLKAVPAERYEAAHLDGATDRQVTWYVTLPSIRPTMLFATLILTIQSFQVFDLVYVMTGGGPLFVTDTLVNELYREGFVNFRTGYASAISWVLFAIIMIISALQLRLFRYNDVD